MFKPEKHDNAMDELQFAAWRIEALSELFFNLKSDGFHMSESGLHGLAIILEDIRDKINASESILCKLKDKQ